MGISLTKLQKKKLDVGMKRLSAYIDVERWLAMCNASPEEMQRLAEAWPQPHPSYTYDAATVGRILGLPCTASDSVVPKAADDGEIVIYYGGWDLPTLRNCAAGRERMYQQDWYAEKEWTAEAGYYRLLLPVPGSNEKRWDEQVQQIERGWEPAPVCVAATAYLTHLAKTGEDLLKGDFTRCAETLPDGRHVALDVFDGRLGVRHGLDDRRGGRVWLSAARKC